MKLSRATLFVTLGSLLLGGVTAYAQQPLTGEADSARAAAIKECSDKAAKISGRDYQDWQITAYRSCMFDYGQLE